MAEYHDLKGVYDGESRFVVSEGSPRPRSFSGAYGSEVGGRNTHGGRVGREGARREGAVQISHDSTSAVGARHSK